MRLIKLLFDHTRTENGKRVLHKAGTEIVVSVKEYDQITDAVRASRVDLRERAISMPGSPEWHREKQK